MQKRADIRPGGQANGNPAAQARQKTNPVRSELPEPKTDELPKPKTREEVLRLISATKMVLFTQSRLHAHGRLRDLEEIGFQVSITTDLTDFRKLIKGNKFDFAFIDANNAGCEGGRNLALEEIEGLISGLEKTNPGTKILVRAGFLSFRERDRFHARENIRIDSMLGFESLEGTDLLSLGQMIAVRAFHMLGFTRYKNL